ncbi:hypothetical protein [Georgenia yuyongxinii]
MNDLERAGLVLARDRQRSADPGEPRPSRDPDLISLRRGAYVSRSHWQEAPAARKYRYFVEATVAAMRAVPVLSHESAAVLLGLPIIGGWPDRVHITEAHAGGGRSSTFIVKHGVRRPPDVQLVSGRAVTAAARTVLDLARTRSFASALATADFALRTGLTSTNHLRADLEHHRGTRGFRQAQRVVERADGRAESVGESLSRARMYELGLPVPDLQHDFYDEDGFVGRSDFWWKRLRIIGEFDGKAKYRRDGYAGEVDPGEIVWIEKRREDRFRPLVARVVRWGWADAWSADRFRVIMARAGIRAHG